MRASEVYLRAAEDVADGDANFACCAIDEVLHHRFSPERMKYMEIMGKRDSGGCATGWFGYFNDIEARDRRVLSLLFAHQVALDEERSK